MDEEQVRGELNKKHLSGVGRIIPGDFLELEHHWADVIDLVFLFNESGRMPLLPSGRMWAQSHTIIAVDMHLLGNGDVVGDGPEIFYIGRINGNHFVPLRPISTGSASGSTDVSIPHSSLMSDCHVDEE